MKNTTKEEITNLLQNFTSEQMLFEIHRRNDIFIEGWYNSNHIFENTQLPKEYHNHFIKYCNDNAICEKLEDSIEEWLEFVKEELHRELICDWFFDYMAFGGCAEINHESPELFRDFISERTEICYEDNLGLYPFIDLSYKKEDGDAKEIQNMILDLCDVFKPHQGNLKTHLEEIMQEKINEYFNV